MSETSRGERPTRAEPPARPRGRITAAPREPHELRLVPTSGARWLAALGALVMLSGVSSGSAPLITLGGLLLSLLAAAWFTAAQTQLALADTTITVLEAKAEGRPLSLAVGRPVTLTARFAPPPGVRAAAITLSPRGSEPLQLAPAAATPENAPTEDGELSRFTVLSPRLGRAFIHGFLVRAELGLGLFSAAAWVRREVTLRALPERLLARAPDLAATRAADSHSDQVQRDKRGFGTEIRELRDFVPGDPFKHIAWRASARRGKLVAREFESDRSLSVWLCLDVSPSMWWGPPGKARIDHALGIACELTRALTAGRDKVGLVLHDHQSRVVIAPGRGPLQAARMTEALLEVPQLYLEDLTEVTPRELVAHVARWFELQERRTFPPPRPRRRGSEARPLPRQTPQDLAALAAACRARLGEARKRILPIAAYAVDPDLATLRAFCREVGITLAPDPTPRPGGQAQGLEAVLGAILTPQAGKKASAHTLISLTDLHSADDQDALRRVALAARRHRHNLVFVLPVGERAELADPVRTWSRRRHAAPDRLQRALLEIQELRAEETRRVVQAMLRPAGATFLTMAPGDSPTRVLSRLHHAS